MTTEILSQSPPLNPSGLVERFYGMTKRDPSTGCILWARAKNRKGYGQIRVDGRLRIAHRLAWELEHGPIPPGIMVLHRCDTPSCVNAREGHLFLGTNSDNQKDSAAKGRHWMKKHPEKTTLNRGGVHICPRGEQCRTARLTASDVKEIRRLRSAGVPGADVAKAFGITRSHAYQVAGRYRWRHVS